MKFSSIFLLGSSLFLFSALFPVHAASENIPSLGKKCFIFDTKVNKAAEPYQSNQSFFSASLVGTGLTLNVETLHLSDAAKQMLPEELSEANALSAYLALSGYYHGISPNCPGLPYKELEKINGKLPSAVWENIRMERPVNLNAKEGLHQKIFIKHLNIHALKDPKNGIRGLFEATGVTGENAPLTPKQARGDFTFTPNVNPPYKIIVRKMEGIVGESRISGQGYVLAGEDISHSKSKAHLSIGKIGSLIEQASSTLGPRATAALLIARLLSHREDDEKVSWEIELDNGASKVNGINIPYFVH